MNRLDEFKKNYEKSMATIQKYLERNDELQPLVKWLLETDENPYTYLPPEWADGVTSASEFVKLLHQINHAYLDDGELTFCTVRDEPRIVFYNANEEDFSHVAKRDAFRGNESNPVFASSTVMILNCTPEEFCRRVDQNQIENLKRCFSSDVARFGVDFAIKHYSHYRFFSEDWQTECSEQIAKYQRMFDIVNKHARRRDD